jgi:hypothetical protein
MTAFFTFPLYARRIAGAEWPGARHRQRRCIKGKKP